MSTDKNKITAFEHVYKSCYTWLFYQVLDYTLDEEVARDMVEEVFVDLWSKFDNIRQEEAVGLLRKLVRNRLVNYSKHQLVVKKYEDEVRLTSNEIQEEDEDELYEERLRQVYAVMDRQPPQRRFIFEQCCLKDKSYKEVAELIGVEVSTIHKHISRVYAELRAMVEKIESRNG